MTIEFFINKSDNNIIDKELEYYGSISGTLKTATSIIAPIILIEFKTYLSQTNGFNQNINEDDVNSIFKCNYAHIPIFNRYYYITNIISVRDGMWEVHMRVDVLRSFEREILNNRCLIARNEFDFNEMLIDGSIESEYLFEYEYKEVSGFACDGLGCPLEHSYARFNDETRFLVSTVNDTDTGVSNAYGFSSNFSDIYQLDNNAYTKFTKSVTNASFVDNLMNLFADKAKTVSSVKLIPFKIQYICSRGLNSVDKLYVGTSKIEDISCIRYNEGDAKVLYLTFCEDFNRIEMREHMGYIRTDDSMKQDRFTPIRIEPTFNNFLDYAPYTSISMFLPFLGYVDLDPELVIGKDFYIVYVVDPLTFDCTIVLTYNPIHPALGVKKVLKYNIYWGTERGIASRDIVAMWKTNISVDLPFGSSGQNDLIRTIAGAGLAAVTKGVSSAFSTGGGTTSYSRAYTSTASDDIIQFGTVNEGKASTPSVKYNPVFGETLKTLLSFSPAPHISSGGGGGSMVTLGQTISFKIRRVKPIRIEGYPSVLGRPLMEYRKLSDLNGYTLVASTFNLSVPSATENELSEIKQILESGYRI